MTSLSLHDARPPQNLALVEGEAFLGVIPALALALALVSLNPDRSCVRLQSRPCQQGREQARRLDRTLTLKQVRKAAPCPLQFWQQRLGELLTRHPRSLD